jgi:hypothetical protein
MASSYSTDLKLELMVTGENSGTWGDKTNTNLNLLQQAIAGYQAIALTSTNTTLAMTDATISDARNAVIKFIGALSANSTVFVATGIEKTYIINNGTTGAYTLALNQVGGSSVIWGTTEKNIKGVYLDGTNANTIDLSTLGGSINTSTALAGGIVTSTQIASFAVTSTGLDTSAVTSVKIASFAVTAAALDTASVTSFKIAAGAVGPTQLSNTAVTAGSYTRVSITVDAQGRITAASSGAAATSGMEVPVLYSVGPASGTFTASPTANRIGVYMVGGGGASGTGDGGCRAGGTGGNGGFGFYNKPIVQPFSQPYSVGGSAGNTTIANVGTVNAGNRGGNYIANGPGNPGNAGSAPLASLTYPDNNFIIGSPYGNGGTGSTGVPQGPFPGNPGVLVVFANTGT